MRKRERRSSKKVVRLYEHSKSHLINPRGKLHDFRRPFHPANGTFRTLQPPGLTGCIGQVIRQGAIQTSCRLFGVVLASGFGRRVGGFSHQPICKIFTSILDHEPLQGSGVKIPPRPRCNLAGFWTSSVFFGRSHQKKRGGFHRFFGHPWRCYLWLVSNMTTSHKLITVPMITLQDPVKAQLWWAFFSKLFANFPFSPRISGQKTPPRFFLFDRGTIVDKKRHGTIRRHRLSQGHEEKHLGWVSREHPKNC